MAAVQAEEQVDQLDANAGRAVIALVAQSEEDVRLTAVSAETAASLSLCAHSLWLVLLCSVSQQNKTKSLKVGAYLMRKVPSGACESISCASSIVIDPQ